ncbi:ECF transporter S component [Facklamia lactis]|uniref:ECF transporter S component n=1 Tax=Facklamia lactis TaxID=2749967 RepID=UPI0018CD2625|nr:ECF transporter S component [Facklamia lactis]MBG9980575.1 ECF transporter S component [Facklamia lactis]
MSANKTFKYVQIGIYAALIIIAITYIRIPMPSAISNSFVHPGNALVILAVLLMGFKRGATAACMGLFLFDLMNGYLAVAHFTVLENLIVLLIVAVVYQFIFKKKDHWGHIVSLGILGALVKIIVIFIKFIIQQMLLGSAFPAAFAMAVTGMPASLFTGLITIILVPLLYFPMKRIFERYHVIGE